ncbi:minor tail protein [Mycobacterium phage Kimona]|uniref:Minor tail protein n=1 Tax=Mycobacterium phage Kimona TaxID=2024295 RepID=A0A249XTZ5_9CAUD|nr:minor tail protein [Mycobacterium phage Kimona]ASZ75463.1 minor tail protein [Mycobacterium phage Kimona]
MSTLQADSWWDLAAYAIVGVPATLAAIAAWRGHRAVTNGHKTHVRDDIDALAKSVDDGFKQMREELHEVKKDIGGLREELRTERIERIEGDRLRLVGGR